jgi:hypothetical protein
MGVVVQIRNIQSTNNFKLFYKVGRTPGSSSEQSSLTWGTQYTGGTSVGGIFSGGTTSISIDLILESIDVSPYGKQYWFKMLDVVTNSFIIENIYVHEYEFYGRCVPTPTPTSTPTVTPTVTSTPTSTSTPTITPTVTPTSTPTITPTPTFTSTPTITPTITLTTTPTVLPTETPLFTSFTIYVDTSNNGLGWSTGELACAGTGTMRTVYVDGTGYSSLHDAVVTYGKALHSGSTINESTLFDGGGLWYKTVANPNEGGNFTISSAPNAGQVPTFNQTGCVVTPSYGISVSPSEASDGGGAYGATVTATNISFPQTYYITILSTVGTVNSSDFQMDFPSTISLTGSSQSYYFSLAEDLLTEGTEKFKLQLRSGSSSGTILATSNEVTILDTSLSPYYYTLIPCAGGSNQYSTGNPPGTFTSGDIVEGATETYYVIGGSTTTDPGGIKITVFASILEDCPIVPTPTPDPGQIILIHTGQTYFNTTEPCAMSQFAIATNGRNVYLNGTNVPANGLYAYNTAACLVGDEYIGDSNYYASIANSIKYAFTIGSGGYINNVTVCT